MHSPAALRILGLTAAGRAAEVRGQGAAGDQRRLLGASAGLGLVGVVVDLARPWPLAFAVDHAIGRDPVADLPPTPLLIAAALATVLIAAVSGLLNMIAVTTVETAAEHIGADLRRRLFAHLVTLSPHWHDRMRSGELVSRFTTDVGRLLDALVALTSTLLPDTLRLGLVLAILTALDVQLAVVAVAVVPVLMVFAVRQRRRVRAVNVESRSASGRLASTATDLIRNVRAVQSFGQQRRSGQVFGARNDAVLASNTRAVIVESRWSPVADIVLAVGSGLVLVVGGREVVSGQLSTGELLVVMSYLTSLYSPIRGLSRLSGVLAKSTASAARIDEVLSSRDRIVEAAVATPLPGLGGEIRFREVCFAYETGRPVLDNLDLTVRAGETVAIIGPSGCGKSTTLALLLRLYDADAGSITIDGLDVRQTRLEDLRRSLAYVPQDAWLLDATVAENIAYGSQTATRRSIRDAGRVALVDEITAGMPHGYDSAVGEGGSRLSGGQRRRIALARAVVSDAPIVLLDEPTASLDPASAAQLVRAIRSATAGRTVLLVTHDPDLAATADRIVSFPETPHSVGPQIPHRPTYVREEVTS